MQLPYNKSATLLKLILYTDQDFMYRFDPMAIHDGPKSGEGSVTSSRGADGAARLSTSGLSPVHPVDLMSEFTICESFSGPAPYGIILGKPSSYGAMVAIFSSVWTY